MRVGFLVTWPYQVYHYKWIAPHVPAPVALLEARGRDYGLTEAFVRKHLSDCEVEWVDFHRLPDLDGRLDAVMCQTQVPPLALLRKTYLVAQQYSLAKERYQYGVWRSHAHLNLMYGHYSVERVGGFSHAVAVGNPLLDPYFQAPPAARTPIGAAGSRPRLLYLPTHDELCSLPAVLPRLRHVDAEITLKLHHVESVPKGARGELARQRIRLVYSDADPIALLREHDGVISDMSGAAYDALYAGVPVVLTPPGGAPSREHLSPEEYDHAALAGVTATWWHGDDLCDAFAAAAAKLESPAYRSLLASRFVNPGTAGAAAAREIQRLVTEGEPYHFGARQVREATRRVAATGRAYHQLRWRLVSARPLYRAATRMRSRWRSTRRRLAPSAGARRVLGPQAPGPDR